MSFPVPVKYNLNPEKNNTVVVYNNSEELDLLPVPRCISESDILFGSPVLFGQLVFSPTFSVSGGMVSTDSAGVGTFTASATGNQVYKTGRLLANQVILASITYKTETPTADVKMRVFARDINGETTTEWQTLYNMYKPTATGIQSVGVVDRRAEGFDSILVKNAMFINFTDIFGETLADAIYTADRNNPGFGAMLFKFLFPKESYPYTTGTNYTVGFVKL